MNSFKNKIFLRNAVKKGFDNLPSGVCFFSSNGIAVLCNRCMTRLIFEMTGRDLQSLSELSEVLNMQKTAKEAVRNGLNFTLPNGDSWHFNINEIQTNDGSKYTEVIASNVTELTEKQRQLSEVNEARRQTVAALERIQDDVVDITREEEILSMKMRIHNEFGYNLQTIRRFFQHGCPAGEKETFLTKQKEMLRKMRGEIGNDDEVDSLAELYLLAASLDMEIVYKGTVPNERYVRKLLTLVLRECLMNTCRHAKGNKIFVDLNIKNLFLAVRVTNNGETPKKEIVEGGGLTSLRAQIEKSGGSIVINSFPEFVMSVEIPLKREI